MCSRTKMERSDGMFSVFALLTSTEVNKIINPTLNCSFPLGLFPLLLHEIDRKRLKLFVYADSIIAFHFSFETFKLFNFTCFKWNFN